MWRIVMMVMIFSGCSAEGPDVSDVYPNGRLGFGTIVPLAVETGSSEAPYMSVVVRDTSSSRVWSSSWELEGSPDGWELGASIDPFPPEEMLAEMEFALKVPQTWTWPDGEAPERIRYGVVTLIPGVSGPIDLWLDMQISVRVYTDLH